MTETPITIKVTQKHIDLGSKGHCRACPIANAAWDTFKPMYLGVGADVLFIWMSSNSEPTKYLLPQVAQNFIESFDALGYGEPFEFEVTPIFH